MKYKEEYKKDTNGHLHICIVLFGICQMISHHGYNLRFTTVRIGRETLTKENNSIT